MQQKLQVIEVGAGISDLVASNWAKLSDTQMDTSCIELCDRKSGSHMTQDPGSKCESLAVFVSFAAFSQRFPFRSILQKTLSETISRSLWSVIDAFQTFQILRVLYNNERSDLILG